MEGRGKERHWVGTRSLSRELRLPRCKQITCVLNVLTRYSLSPHTLSPEVLYLATLSPHLAPIADELTMKLKAQRERNEELLSGIQNQRAEIEQLVTGLEAVVTDLEGAVDTVQSASNEFDNADEMEGIENGRSRL